VRIRPRSSRMKLYSYIVKNDTGFAPNPFFDYCTLACCKPGIRKTAQKGDWVVGLSPKADGNGVVFFMQVNEDPIGFDAYWNDARFRMKRPTYDAGIIRECGDNIYEPQLGGGYRQLRSMHSDGDREDHGQKNHDLSGTHILISESFGYFGSEPLELRPKLSPLIVQRGFRSRFSEEVKAEFLRFVEVNSFGVRAKPQQWPTDDASWRNGGSGCLGTKK
jgi:Nucleotide modification associated domain 2